MFDYENKTKVRITSFILVCLDILEIEMKMNFLNFLLVFDSYVNIL